MASVSVTAAGSGARASWCEAAQNAPAQHNTPGPARHGGSGNRSLPRHNGDRAGFGKVDQVAVVVVAVHFDADELRVLEVLLVRLADFGPQPVLPLRVFDGTA